MSEEIIEDAPQSVTIIDEMYNPDMEFNCNIPVIITELVNEILFLKETVLDLQNQINDITGV